MNPGDAVASERGVASAVCAWCRRPLPARTGPGRPRRYCRAGCRQQAYVARRVSAGEERGERAQVVDRTELEDAQDRIELLRRALADLERERAAGGLADLALAFDWLHRHAAEVADVRLGPLQRTTTRSVGDPSPSST